MKSAPLSRGRGAGGEALKGEGPGVRSFKWTGGEVLFDLFHQPNPYNSQP